MVLSNQPINHQYMMDWQSILFIRCITLHLADKEIQFIDLVLIQFIYQKLYDYVRF